MQVDDAMVGAYLLTLSLRPLDEIGALLAEHAAAPERRLAQRALADELTELVHGAEAADAAARGRRGALRRRPDAAPASGLEAVAAEVPNVGSRATSTASGARAARRRRLGQVEQRGPTRCSPRAASGATERCSTRTAGCAESDLLSGGFVLLRKGKQTTTLVGKVLHDSRLTPPGRSDSVAPRLRTGSARRRHGTTRSGLPCARACPSFGSLKTEEKTERQCGQRRVDLRVTAELSVNSMSHTCRSQPVGSQSDLDSAVGQLSRSIVHIEFVPARTMHRDSRPSRSDVLVGEFDPGSGRTLAACLTHASRTRSILLGKI